MDTIKFKNKDYEIIEIFHNNKIHAKRNNKDFIIIPFDTYSNFLTYISNKKILKKNKVEMSKILKKDKKGLLVLEEYIKGINVIEIVAAGEIKPFYNELFRLFRNNRFAKISLNYKPHNFVLKGKYFYYVSDEVSEYNKNKSFERTIDFLLWMDTKECKDYIISKGYKFKERELLKEGAILNKEIALLCVLNW